MNKPNFKGMVDVVKTTLSKNSPGILTGLGIAGMITTTVLAVKATPKALQLIEEEKKIRFPEKGGNGYDENGYIPKLDVVKLTWKCYIPAVISGGVSIACLIGANSVHARRNAALATAYKLSETAFSEYKEKVVETIGEKKEQVIKDKINEDRVANTPVNGNSVIITGGGDTWFLDYHSKRYFQSDLETMRGIENRLNKRMINGEMYISLSEVYDEIGLEHTSNSDELGWSIDKDGLLDFGLEHPGTAVMKNGKPCIVLDYRVAPRYDFSKLM